MTNKQSVLLLCVVSATGIATGFAQSPQNPSPMVEHTRSHQRLEKTQAAGNRQPLALGTLFVPAALSTAKKMPLVVHFHGGDWLPQVAATQWRGGAVMAVQLGGGSSVYAKPFSENEKLFDQLLSEAAAKSGIEFDAVVLSGWSAGYGAIRQILRQQENLEHVDAIVLLDGLHTGYNDGKPGPLESDLERKPLEPFLQFGKLAIEGSKVMVLTHSTVFPGTFASTTETSDYLVAELQLHRRAVLEWGPGGMQQLSEASAGKLLIQGFAGNSAPDHVDHLHAAAHFWDLAEGLLTREPSPVAD